MFLQETYTTAKIEKIYKYQWHGNMIFSYMAHLIVKELL